jgi:hypothetical protein
LLSTTVGRGIQVKWQSAHVTYSTSGNSSIPFACPKDANPSGSRVDQLAKDEADPAMAWLVKAVAAGFNDRDRLAKPKEFDSVRDRANFRKLMAELEAKQH